MTEFYTEFDEIQEALKRVRLDEEVAPMRYGMLVKEGADTYNKMQKLLACNEMEDAYTFLYDLDPENLEDSDIDKINRLFDMGVKKGYIDNSFDEEFDKEENPTAVVPDEEPVAQSTGCYQTVGKANIPCWTILYSATKDGEIKCGECFSNAISVSAAKADCTAKLAKFGYDNIQIMAIEAGDPDCACCNEDDMLKNRVHNAHKSDEELNERYDPEAGMTYQEYAVQCTYEVQPQIGEIPHEEVFDDIIEGASIKSMIGMLTAKIAREYGVSLHKVRILEFDSVLCNDRDITDKANAVLRQLHETANNPYAAGMKVVTGGKVSACLNKASRKCVKEDDDEGSEDTGSDDEGSDDTSSDDEGSDDEGSDDTGSDDEGSDDEGSDDMGFDDEGSDAEDSDAEASDDEGSDDEESDDEDSDDDDSDDDDSDDEGSDDKDSDSNLSDEEKSELKTEYKQVFKDVMLKCKFVDKCFNDLTIDEKVKFFEKLQIKWKKAEPNEFMTPKEEEQLNAIVVTE